jgi:hypothetical protein
MVVLVALFLLIAGCFSLFSQLLAAVEATLQSLKSLGLMQIGQKWAMYGYVMLRDPAVSCSFIAKLL